MIVYNQLTKKAGGWIPRLERMVQSRGLCQFEKQVLLTLIGFVIQPTMVRKCSLWYFNRHCIIEPLFSRYPQLISCSFYMHVHVHVHVHMHVHIHACGNIHKIDCMQCHNNIMCFKCMLCVFVVKNVTFYTMYLQYYNIKTAILFCTSRSNQLKWWVVIQDLKMKRYSPLEISWGFFVLHWRSRSNTGCSSTRLPH